MLLKLIPYTLIWILFTFIYLLMPNIRVNFLSGLLAGVVAGTLYQLAQWGYITFQIGASRYNAIYGSFATLPLFLLWMQLGWIIFLSGAEMAFAVQFWRQYSPAESRLTPIARLTLAFNIVNHALADFKTRRVTTRANLAETIKQPETSVNSVINELVQGGILRAVQGRQESYAPASPAETIRPAEIVDLILGTEAPHLTGDALAMEALMAARQALADKTITGDGFFHASHEAPGSELKSIPTQESDHGSLV